jgi:hypothetical protein
MRNIRLIKTEKLGRADGIRTRGRQKRRSLNDIKDWTRLDIQQAVHMAHDRKRYWAGKNVPTVGPDGP